MKTARRNSGSRTQQVRSNSLRPHGRITKEDIRAASLRRWDGNARITTDWVNLFQEPELCFPEGDILIYLREPGQTSRGPAFRVYKAHMKERGFEFLLDKCISRPPLHPGTKCLGASCFGCDLHSPPSELYIPAPADADLDAVFDHHVTTRNFFAWLYNLPLTGRALGRSLVMLKERIDYYRPQNPTQSGLEVVSYAEAQRYLDFRECLDHALAALLLAECLQIEDLWVDAFAHCVGMSHRGLNNSLEYWAISYETRLLINHAQAELETRLESARVSICDFFEDTLSGNFLGLPQTAKDHLDHFRSWLHTYHIEQYGFWPPKGFRDDAVEFSIYSTMYSDFSNLYYHLMDPKASTGITDIHMSASGGVCTTQNIQAFDSRHRYETLPKTMPLLPKEPESDTQPPALHRRKSWNPLTRRRIDRDKKKVQRIQALIAASNRDWAIMECPLVRRYSEFESQSIIDDPAAVSMVDGRKVRWILIYAILQTIMSIMRTPNQVRNADGLTYWLCCQPPSLMPWQTISTSTRVPTLQKRRSVIEPDTQYLHSNSSSQEISESKPSRTVSKQVKEKRRQSLPARISSISTRPLTANSSIRRFISGRNPADDATPPPPVPKSSPFCEILVQGYGNGLNEVDKTPTAADDYDDSSVEGEQTPKARPTMTIITTNSDDFTKTEPNSASTDRVPDLTPTSSTSVSRESSNASSNSSWSKSLSTILSNRDTLTEKSEQSMQKPTIPIFSNPKLNSIEPADERRPSDDLNHVLDEEGFMRTVHFNTKTWDALLST